MGEKKYKGFDDTNIENDFKPKKSKEKIPNLPKFLEDKRKEENLKVIRPCGFLVMYDIK